MNVNDMDITNGCKMRLCSRARNYIETFFIFIFTLPCIYFCYGMSLPIKLSRKARSYIVPRERKAQRSICNKRAVLKIFLQWHTYVHICCYTNSYISHFLYCHIQHIKQLCNPLIWIYIQKTLGLLLNLDNTTIECAHIYLSVSGVMTRRGVFPRYS